MEQVKRYELYYWGFVIGFLILIVPLQFYWPMVAPLRYTRELPVDNPGALTSDIWSWGMIRESFYAFAYLIILSGLFMVFTRSKVGRGVHMVVLFIFGIWFLVMGAFDIKDMAYGQVGPHDPNFTPYNPARDSRWCGLYGLDLGTERLCANTKLYDFSPFTTNPNFMFRVIMNATLFVFVVLDGVFTAGFYAVAAEVDDYTTLTDTELVTRRIKRRV